MKKQRLLRIREPWTPEAALWGGIFFAMSERVSCVSRKGDSIILYM